MYLDEVHGYGDNRDDDDQPSGLSYSAWTRDKDIVRQLLSEPDAHDPVKPPDIYEMFDGPNPRLAGRTRWGNAFGAPQLDENGEYIDPDALVEKWKVRYYEFRRERELRASDPINPNGPSPRRDSDNRPSGLSREAWRKDKRMIKRLLREPGAHARPCGPTKYHDRRACRGLVYVRRYQVALWHNFLGRWCTTVR